MDDGTLAGVKKAKVILASFYLVQGRDDYAKMIQQDMNEESAKNLWFLHQELRYISTREFWEVSERGILLSIVSSKVPKGTNFIWLTDRQKQELPRFFSWFKNHIEGEVPLSFLEKKKIREQQMMNFETSSQI